MNMNKIGVLATILVALVLVNVPLRAQERVVKVDFETNSFVNNPSVPTDRPFTVRGEMGKGVQYVDVTIRHAGSKWDLHRYSWNRVPTNKSKTFNVVVPPVLETNSKYDFQVITYVRLSFNQKRKLVENLRSLIAFYLNGNFDYNGINVSIRKPKKVYQGLQNLLQEALRFHRSKNGVKSVAPSPLVLAELENQKLSLKGSRNIERDDVANELIAQKVNRITDMIIGEVMPFINSDLVQRYREANITSVPTDRQGFTLPVNFGVYAWNQSVRINNETKFNNIDFSLGAGFTIPFMSKSKYSQKSKFLDSFGLSMGVLFSPLKDIEGLEYVTPGINIPVYTALGFRLFKVVRFNAGVLIVGEKGTNKFNGLTVTPTVGLALELDLWLGIKK